MPLRRFSPGGLARPLVEGIPQLIQIPAFVVLSENWRDATMPIQRLTVTDLITILLVHQPRPGHMWFLGAGASVSSGVPAAGEIVFKMLSLKYVQQTSKALTGTRSADEPRVRRWAKQSLLWFDPRGKKSEYVQVMENVLKNRATRNLFLERLLRFKTPGDGYRRLGRLIKRGAITTIWTTNFDSLVQKSVSDLRDPLEIVNSKEQFDTLDPASTRQRLIRLHGDCWHGDLVNTPEEFRKTPGIRYEALGRLLISQGLVVVGYGGRDAELMKALTRTAQQEGVLRMGLFWCLRKSEPPAPLVRDLLGACGERGYLVEIDGFDELMAEVEEAFDLNQRISTYVADDPHSAQETQALLVDLCDQLALSRPAREAREGRRTALLSLCRLIGAWGAAVVVRLATFRRKIAQSKPDR